jgi:hypothetical protein
MARGWLVIFVLWIVIFAILMCHPSWTVPAWKKAAWALLWACVSGFIVAINIFLLVTFFN